LERPELLPPVLLPPSLAMTVDLHINNVVWFPWERQGPAARCRLIGATTQRAGSSRQLAEYDGCSH
jgi:hypothetical protein